MEKLQNYINKKRILMEIIGFISFVIFFSTLTRVNCFKIIQGSGSVLDPIADSITWQAEHIVDPFAEKVVKSIIHSFTPGYGLYWALTNRTGYIVSTNFSEDGKIDWNTDYEYKGLNGDMAGDRSNPIINTIFEFSQKFGIALASILVIFFLLLCLVGQADQIKDTPLQLISKFTACVFLIVTSWSITYRAISIVGSMWESFVMSTSDGSSLTYAHMATVLSADDAKDGALSILGCVLDFEVTIIGRMLFVLMSLFLIWKLFKNFLRLYMECAERYFVLTMMTLFFPAICPTVISNSTTNVMHSYIRMFISQGFLLLVNGIFMKIYVAGFIAGWWTKDLLGYVCALVFVKFATKIDTYMHSMGLTVAQTGASFTSSCGGAFLAMGSAIRSISHMERMGQNIGTALINKGLTSGSKEIYERGMTLKGGFANRIVNGATKVSDTDFSRAVYDNTKSQERVASMPTRKGQEISVNNGGPSFNDACNMLGVTASSLNDGMSVSGISGENVSKITCISGGTESSVGNSTILQMEDSAGNHFVTSKTNGYGYASFAADYDSYNNSDDSMELLSADDQSNMFGAPAIRTSYPEFGHQTYEVEGNDHSGFETYSADVRVVSEHPEVLMDNSRTLYTREDGTTLSYKLSRISEDKNA